MVRIFKGVGHIFKRSFQRFHTKFLSSTSKGPSVSIDASIHSESRTGTGEPQEVEAGSNQRDLDSQDSKSENIEINCGALLNDGVPQNDAAAANKVQSEEEERVIKENYEAAAFLMDTVFFIMGTIIYIYYIVVDVFGGADTAVLRQIVSTWNVEDDYIIEHYTVANNFSCSYGLWSYCPDYGIGERPVVYPRPSDYVHPYGYAHG